MKIKFTPINYCVKNEKRIVRNSIQEIQYWRHFYRNLRILSVDIDLATLFIDKIIFFSCFSVIIQPVLALDAFYALLSSLGPTDLDQLVG